MTFNYGWDTFHEYSIRFIFGHRSTSILLQGVRTLNALRVRAVDPTEADFLLIRA